MGAAAGVQRRTGLWAMCETEKGKQQGWGWRTQDKPSWKPSLVRMRKGATRRKALKSSSPGGVQLINKLLALKTDGWWCRVSLRVRDLVCILFSIIFVS